MSYNPTKWTDGTTPLDASNMNKIEDALSDQDSRIDANSDLIGKLDSYFSGQGILNYYRFNNSTPITTQLETLAEANNSTVVMGFIISSGSTTALDMPATNGNYYVLAFMQSSAYMDVLALCNSQNVMYIRSKDGNTNGWRNWQQIV